ncbi:MAG TPA: sulfite exporter TauE/SafE family protein [Xanthobacteraceae bacterium]|nr:sulfite exporter TauE/SafE family protein [Xanthobacteraceae bacterium]
MQLHDLVSGIGVGLIGGFTSGLLGVSPGGALVVFSVFLLGAEQHVAQGISLAAQVPPTSASGIKRYLAKGSRSPLRWLVLLTIGFVGGGIVGAYAASFVSRLLLQWTYVGYLVGLDAMLIARGARTVADQDQPATKHLHWAALLTIGLFAGLSSGFIGIGGGLATVVGLHVVLGVPQRQAQMISLILSLIPTTIPSAWVYWSQGWTWSWAALVGVIVGLVIGTDLGARLANRINSRALYATLIFFVSIMAAYMTLKALS